MAIHWQKELTRNEAQLESEPNGETIVVVLRHLSDSLPEKRTADPGRRHCSIGQACISDPRAASPGQGKRSNPEGRIPQGRPDGFCSGANGSEGQKKAPPRRLENKENGCPPTWRQTRE